MISESAHQRVVGTLGAGGEIDLDFDFIAANLREGESEGERRGVRRGVSGTSRMGDSGDGGSMKWTEAFEELAGSIDWRGRVRSKLTFPTLRLSGEGRPLRGVGKLGVDI